MELESNTLKTFPRIQVIGLKTYARTSLNTQTPAIQSDPKHMEAMSKGSKAKSAQSETEATLNIPQKTCRHSLL
mgnify:CR=1 FL=1